MEYVRCLFPCKLHCSFFWFDHKAREPQYLQAIETRASAGFSCIPAKYWSAYRNTSKAPPLLPQRRLFELFQEQITSTFEFASCCLAEGA